MNMSYFGGSVPFAPRAGAYGRLLLPTDVWSGVRTRRILAFGIDVVFVGLLGVVVLPLALAALAVPLGPILFAGSLILSWFAVPVAFPVIAFFYNGLSVSGRGMGTPGMRLMDLEVRHADGGRAPFLNAAAQAVLFYLSWTFPPVFLVSLVTSDKSCLHDIFAELRVMRRLR
jgi:uncharacterized RDD family membrane protein YckC